MLPGLAQNHVSTRNAIVEVSVKNCVLDCYDSAFRNESFEVAQRHALGATVSGSTASLGLVATGALQYGASVSGQPWPRRGVLFAYSNLQLDRELRPKGARATPPDSVAIELHRFSSAHGVGVRKPEKLLH